MLNPDPHRSPNDTTACCRWWPRPGTYRIGQHTQVVLVLGLARDGEVRILDETGSLRTVREHRVRIPAPA